MSLLDLDDPRAPGDLSIGVVYLVVSAIYGISRWHLGRAQRRKEREKTPETRFWGSPRGKPKEEKQKKTGHEYVLVYNSTVSDFMHWFHVSKGFANQRAASIRSMRNAPCIWKGGICIDMTHSLTSIRSLCSIVIIDTDLSDDLKKQYKPFKVLNLASGTSP